MRAYLRRCRVVRANLAAGACSSQLDQSGAIFSPDCSQLAVLGPGSVLRVLDASSGLLQRAYELPSVPAQYCKEQPCTWSPCNQHMVLLFGRAWDDGFSTQAADPCTSGFVVLHLQSGACTVEVLPNQAGAGLRGHACAIPCTNTGLLLVQHLDSDGDIASTVYDAIGTRTASLVSSEVSYRACNVSWAPAGQRIAFLPVDEWSVLLWDFAAGTPLLRVSLCVDEEAVYHYCWTRATPFSGHALAGACWDKLVLGFVTPQAQCILAPLPDAPGRLCCAVWGLRLAVLICDQRSAQPFVNDQLHLCSIQHGQLAVEQTITVAPRSFMLALGSASSVSANWAQCKQSRLIALSPDAELAAALLQSESAPYSNSLAIIDLATGRMQEFECPECPDGSSLDYLEDIRWTPDSSAVLVTGEAEGVPVSWLFDLA